MGTAIKSSGRSSRKTKPLVRRDLFTGVRRDRDRGVILWGYHGVEPFPN